VSMTCKFCGLELSHGVNHRFVALGRTARVESVAGIVANAGECLNAAGQLTRHHPNAPEWNGGITVYANSLPLGEEWL